MAAELTAAPALSTPADHLFEHVEPEIPEHEKWSRIRNLSNDELHETYEIARTARDIQSGGWRRVALQFPDSMLGDAPWVVQVLGRELARLSRSTSSSLASTGDHADGTSTSAGTGSADIPLKKNAADGGKIPRLYVLADTSYSACCVDEIAAEHVNAEVVVHYGRSCLSPTSRLPVIYVFTKHDLNHNAVLDAFISDFPDKQAKVVLMADVSYQDHVPLLATRLRSEGYERLLSTAIVHNPAGRIPNRKITDSEENETDDLDLLDYSIFHVSKPPASLLLALSSRVKSLHVLPTPAPGCSAPNTTEASAQTTRALLGRRYARLLSLSTAGVIGILVNTLSVSNYLASLDSIRKQISAAGKKSYTVVVGKLNPAKLANFAEIDGWVVVGCWESSLVEDDAGFFRPVITPFELTAALAGDDQRVWGGQWWGGIENVEPSILKSGIQDTPVVAGAGIHEDEVSGNHAPSQDFEDGIEDEESEPPEFDLRTGKLVSNSRPMRIPTRSEDGLPASEPQAHSSALSLRPKADLAMVKGVVSPGAEYLRSQRTWQGLGSDFDHGERGTAIEEGRAGVARGYTVGDDSERR